MAMGTFRIVEHTADKGLEVEASTLPDLFATAARGLFHLMIDPDRYPPTEQDELKIGAPDLEMLMVRWLNELVYQFEVHHRLFSQFEVEVVEPTGDEWRLQARAGYRPITPEALEWEGAPVKSVTYHGLTLQQQDGRWFLRFYVDV
ncbi:MAG: archease [Fimbriimonadales bacterium]|nr:archease [Fimbriimonadales bacterium]